MTKKIQISESDLYNIIKRVLIEQEEEQKEVWITDEDEFKSRLFDVFNGNSEKFTKVHNKHYNKIVVNGYLGLNGTQIASLPDNLYVGGDLDLSRTPIASLPDNLHVFGRLELINTQIKSLPNNLQINKSLILISSKIETLPDNLKVGYCIYIHNTPLSKNNELIKKYADKGHIIITKSVTYSEIFQDEDEIDEYKKFEFELGEQSTEDAKTAYPAVTKWETGIKRGPANSINPKQKWSDTYQTKRGKANTIDSKSKWSTGLTRGKANTLL
jgi:hypothetical protein